MAATTLATVLAAFARLSPEDQAAARTALAIVAEPRAESEASAHWKSRDIACNAPKPCADTFRTVKGRDWHVANVKHA